MKKIVVFLMSLMVMTLLLTGLTACYVSQPDTVESFVGTYELKSYVRRPENAAEDEVGTDMIAEKEISAYLVAKDDGTGYYVYKDKDTPAYARAVKITYAYDDEDSSLLDSIVYDDGMSGSGDGYPGKGRENLGLTFNKKEKHLNFYMPAIFGRKYSQSVSYLRVSDATDLSYASSKLNATFKVGPYELNGLSTLCSSDFYVEQNPYFYRILEINAPDKTADLTYALKTDGVQQKKSGLAITFEYDAENVALLHITIGEETFSRYISSAGSGHQMMGSLSIEHPGTEDVQGWSEYFFNTTQTKEEFITDTEKSYDQYLIDLEEAKKVQMSYTDEATGVVVVGNFLPGATMEVRSYTADDQTYTDAQESVTEGVKNEENAADTLIALYSVALTGEYAQSTGSYLSIDLPIPDEHRYNTTIVVYVVKDDGSVEALENSYFKNGGTAVNIYPSALGTYAMCVKVAKLK